MKIFVIDYAVDESTVLQDVLEYGKQGADVFLLSNRNWSMDALRDLKQLGVQVLGWGETKLPLGSDAELSLLALPAYTSATVPHDAIIRFAGLFRSDSMVFGCPAESKTHVASVVRWCDEKQIPFIRPEGTHGRLVAEYTLLQIGALLRNLHEGNKPAGYDLHNHERAVYGSRTLAGKTLGILGAAGRDGLATAKLATQFGLRVVGFGTGSSDGDMRMTSAGAVVASSLHDLIDESDFISVNCTYRPDNYGILGKKELSLLQENAIVINPAGAELIDADALIDLLTVAQDRRHRPRFVFDKPYQSVSQARNGIDVNEVLSKLGVHFTPRIAGYTSEARAQGIGNVLQSAIAYERSFGMRKDSSELKPQPSSDVDGPDIRAITTSMRLAARAAANAARDSRSAGLQWEYKNDASPVSHADRNSEWIVKELLAKDGFQFNLYGEETAESHETSHDLSIIVDGIDGTRNFRDGNFGWAVSIVALWRGESIAAVVYDGECNRMYFANRLERAFIENESGVHAMHTPVQLPSDFSFSVGSARGTISREIMRGLNDVLKKMGGRNREWGVISLSICAVAYGGFGVALEVNCSQHDFKAALFISEMAGASVNTWPTADPKRYHVCVSHPMLFRDIADRFCSVIAEGQ